MFQIISCTMLSEPEIVSLLSFSALLLVFMMTFLKPDKDDPESEEKTKHEKKLRIDPYLPFMSPTNYSPYIYVHTTHCIPKLHLDV